MFEKLFEFVSAVRGFHHYKKYWQPEGNETLDCGHEENNPYDYFSIKTCQRKDGSIVGHLPKNEKSNKINLKEKKLG